MAENAGRKQNGDINPKAKCRHNPYLFMATKWGGNKMAAKLFPCWAPQGREEAKWLNNLDLFSPHKVEKNQGGYIIPTFLGPTPIFSGPLHGDNSGRQQNGCRFRTLWAGG